MSRRGVCFFFKQKTAYEMRISDWSSDVCSSDLDVITARLLATYRDHGGNLVAIGDDIVLQREGVFAAIATSAAGRYLLQPAVLDALEDGPEAGLAAALLTVAEAWPVTALPPRLRGPRLDRKSTRLNSSH